MILGWNKKISRRLVEMQAEKISLSQLKDMLYDTYETFYIWGKTEKESKTLKRVQAYSVQGPGGRAMSGAQYWVPGKYVKDGYIILYNVEKSGFRTYPIHRITQIEKDGQLFKVG
jgi:hypothetical protein